MSQSVELFSGSLRYNIEYGLKDCTADKVREAAKKVHAEDLVSELETEQDAGTHSTVMHELICFVTRRVVRRETSCQLSKNIKSHRVFEAGP